MYIKFLWRAVASICVALLIAVNLSTSSSAQQTVIVPPPISSQAAPPRPPRYPPRNCITVFLGASRAPKVAGMASRQKFPFIAQTSPFVAAPTVRSMVWPGPVIYTIIVITIALILICFGPFYGANKISKLAARVTWPPGAKVSVKYQLNGREEAEILNPSFDTDGTVSTALTLSEATLRPGDTFSLKHVAAVDTRGVSTGNDIPLDANLLSAPLDLGIPSQSWNLGGLAAATNRYSKYRTGILNSVDGNTKLQSCSGPFKFRIQKEKRQKRRSGGRTFVEVTWVNISKGVYRTNKKAGLWHYRTVNLKKGTYRSVIYGACGLAGMTTSPVTLKR